MFTTLSLPTTFVSCLGVAALAFLPGTQQAGQAKADRTDALLGPELVVDGATISRGMIRRQVVFGTEGNVLVELSKLRLYIEDEIKRRVAAGAKKEDFEVPESEIQAAIADAEKTVDEAYQGQDLDLDDFYPTNDPAWLDQVKLTKLFKRVYLPENPNEFPAITEAALTDGQQGEQLLKVIKEQWDNKQAAIEAGEEPKKDAQGDAFMDMILTQNVIGYLNKTAKIELPEDGLPEDIALRVNGNEIRVDELWKLVEKDIGYADVWKAKKWLLNTHLLQRELEKAGFWIGDEEAAKLYAEHSDPYKESFLSIEKVATSIKKFPTVGNYKSYYRILQSFKRMIADQITDEALEELGRQRTSYLVSQSKVDCDIILLSAYDFKKKSWKKDGWADAARRAKEVSARLAAGEDWGALLEEYSGFYDQPVPTKAQNTPDLKLKDKGRFRGMTRNELLKNLEESEFSIFLSGNAVADFVFFEQEVGTTQNPLKGPYGWYICRLLKRTPATKNLSASDESHRSYLEQDFLARRLNAWLQEILAKSKVEGL